MTLRLLLASGLLLVPCTASAYEIAEPDESTEEVPADSESTETPESEPAPVNLEVSEAEDGDSSAGDEEPSAGSSMADDLRLRQELRPWHIGFGTASVATMYATTILGYLTFADRYGFDGPISGGCVPGNSSLLGAASCDAPFAHATAAITATATFSVAFTLALFMPDPLNAGDGDGEFATMLTIHRALRWGVTGLMIAQVVLGIATSVINASNDYNTARDLAAGHLVLGTVTNAAMTAQGILGSLMAW